ncbi:PE family protein [Mycobacterium attenuatum]|nr:PE family protein [Mycobacterium attenuatum]
MISRWEAEMSFVLAAPEMVTTAAQELAAMHSTLGEASASAAGPTTALLAAAEDEVSTGIAALFGAFGREYQLISSQVQAFHEQFVNLLTASAVAYQSTEAANAGQILVNAVNTPAEALLGQPLIATGTGAAAASSAMTGSLITDTATSLQTIANTWTNKTAPALYQAVSRYPQLISTSLATGNPLPLLALPVQLAQSGNALYQAFTSPISLSTASVSMSGLSLGFDLGVPELLAINALGAPVNAAMAAGTSATSFMGALSAGNVAGATSALFGAPHDIVNAFLNGHQALSMQLPLPGLTVTANIAVSGLLGPLEPFTATVTLPALPLLNTLTVTGPRLGGLVPTLVEYVPELLVTALGP